MEFLKLVNTRGIGYFRDEDSRTKLKKGVRKIEWGVSMTDALPFPKRERGGGGGGNLSFSSNFSEPYLKDLGK